MMDYLIIFFAEYLLYLSLLAVPYLWFGDKRHDLIRIGLSVIFAYALAEGLHLLFPVARPFVAQNFTPLVTVSVGEYYASFPSGHTTFLAALGTASFFTDRWVGVTVIILALLTGMGRVLAGVHYPVDIVGGFLLGATVAGLAKWTHDRYPFW